MKTYDQILKQEYQKKILAHTLNGKNPETLIEHSKKTLDYCNHLIDTLSLEKNFNDMLLHLVPDKQVSDMLELIKSIIYYHDLGKINPVFQKEKMRNNDLPINTEHLNSNHSFYGKILFDNLFFDDFLAKYSDIKSRRLFFLLSQTIDRHHTSLMDINFLYEKMCKDTVQKEFNDLNAISKFLFNNWQDLPPTDNFCHVYNFKGKGSEDIRRLFNTAEQQEALFYLYKTVYSLLITSDYYATSDFMQKVHYFDKISTINQSLVKRCEEKFYRYDFNRKLDDSIYCKKTLSNLLDIADLNELRTRILLEADQKLEKAIANCPEQRVFYLNVPTGGGKTNISMKLAITLLKSKNSIKRVFYVFPFINLIEQNHEVIKETLSLGEELSPIYSSSAWNVELENKEEQLQYAIDNEFLNHPFVVISNVNFFNAFIKSGKNSNYRLINLANSIVIIDEIQSLNDKDWTLFNDLITYGSKHLNIYFIIMSATLPRLDALSDTDMAGGAMNLIDNADDYFHHALFKNRVSIDYKDDVNNLEQLLDVLKDNLVNSMNKILLVVNTVGTSLELYKKVKTDKKILEMDFDICLLNSTMLPHKREEIIEKMKDSNGKTILISTQSVEAGVDIDCDFGIRDFAIFDSIEQIAGRINRNAHNQKNTAKLIVTNLKVREQREARFIYADSHRWQTIDKHIFTSPESVRVFLKNRNFDYYYAEVLKQIKKIDNHVIKKSALDIVKTDIRYLNFQELNKVNIIEQDSVSIIVDATVSKNNFTDSELKFIEQKDQICDTVSGKQIWKMYNKFLKNFQGGFDVRKINTKIWSSVLSKFMINIRNPHDSKILDTKDSSKGIPLLKKEYYSSEEGIDSALLKPNSFLIP